eukprot:TRINITY_DN43161_c0_g1_i1.p1 TRINITY_DN43161_c0_g1~~TRINITY_DN43161_c0_g1_i1.p1  ORF type:complete len:688 (+),score=238.23 TRINITY_DN43161_c0_g1_i1:119-2182(+)
MQVSRAVAISCCLASASGLKVFFDESSSSKERPVTKVVNLLKGMQDQLESEKDADEDLYEKLTCWCKEAKQSTGADVSDAQARISELQSRSAELSATVQLCEQNMASLKDQISAAEAASDEARVLRGKQYDRFKEDDQNFNEDIYAVDSAATVLGNTGSFVQLPDGKKPEDLAKALKVMMDRRAEKMETDLGFAGRDMINALINDPSKFVQNKQAFLQQSAGSEGEPATTFKLMGEDFKKDQKAMQEQERIDKENFEELIAAKKVEIQTSTASREKKRTDKATAKSEMFKAQVEIKDKTKSIAAAAEFSKVMESKCTTSDEEYEERQKTRAEEIQAVGKAIQILDNDDAHAQFSKTFSFIQTDSSESDKRRAQVSSTLAEVGNKLKDSRLVALATTAKLDSFTKVRAAIDGMVSVLKKEEQDEVQQKQFCTNSFNKNKAAVAAQKDAKSGFDTKQTMLTENLNLIAKEVESLKSKIGEAENEMKLAGENRKAEKADFEKTIVDQQLTEQLLSKALTTLRDVYQEKPAAMVQVSKAQAKGPSDAPEGFGDYKKNGKSFGVMSLMQQILAETKAMEAEATRAEKNAEATYQKEMAAAQGNVNALKTGLSSQAENKAKTKLAVLETNKDLEGSEAELAALAQEETDLHATCDFLLNNWDLRVSARREEIESLGKAKGILSGEKSFLQKKK